MKLLKITIICIMMLCVMSLSACRGKSKDYAESSGIEIENVENNETEGASEEDMKEDAALRAREELLSEVGVFDDSDIDESDDEMDDNKIDDVQEQETVGTTNDTSVNEEKDNNTLEELADVPSGF